MHTSAESADIVLNVTISIFTSSLLLTSPQSKLVLAASNDSAARIWTFHDQRPKVWQLCDVHINWYTDYETTHTYVRTYMYVWSREKNSSSVLSCSNISIIAFAYDTCLHMCTCTCISPPLPLFLPSLAHSHWSLQQGFGSQVLGGQPESGIDVHCCLSSPPLSLPPSFHFSLPLSIIFLPLSPSLSPSCSLYKVNIHVHSSFLHKLTTLLSHRSLEVMTEL